MSGGRSVGYTTASSPVWEAERCSHRSWLPALHPVAGPDHVSPQVPVLKPMDLMVEVSPRRIFANGHTYHINSISVNSDCETYMSADDLRINLWHLAVTDRSFSILQRLGLRAQGEPAGTRPCGSTSKVRKLLARTGNGRKCADHPGVQKTQECWHLGLPMPFPLPGWPWFPAPWGLSGDQEGQEVQLCPEEGQGQLPWAQSLSKFCPGLGVTTWASEASWIQTPCSTVLVAGRGSRGSVTPERLVRKESLIHGHPQGWC